MIRSPWILAAQLLLAMTLSMVQAVAQPTGAIEFTAHVIPSAGLSEPARGLPFYLLHKSFADIRKEADASEPKPDLDAFIDKLDVTKELKAWMKRTRSVNLSGEEFVHRVKPDDIMSVPEFFDAYVALNAVDRSVGFPTPKFSGKDPEKKKLEYHEAVHKYLLTNPESVTGLDLQLTETDPSVKWAQLESQRLPAVHRRALELAESKYLAGRAQTDLDGAGSFRGVAPGEYWVSTLEIDATIGDIRLRWDAPVTVHAGETSRLELSNFNAVEPHRSSR